MKKKLLVILMIAASLMTTSCRKKKPAHSICYGQCTAGKVAENGNESGDKAILL